MTEAEWLAAADPIPMLRFLERRTGDRKLWLFSIACHRRVWPALNARVRQAIETSERYVEGRATDADMLLHNTRISVSDSVRYAVPDGQNLSGDPKQEARVQADLLRDIFGNPFRPIAVVPSWLTTDVRLLARGIYEEKAFDRMPILADALQDAGCDSDDLLAHCRDASAAHVRGCWVCDLVTGKE